MASEARGIQKILDKWRGAIKSKKRMIISLEEIMQQKIDSLKPWIFPETEPLDGWTHRRFRYDTDHNRTWVDPDWSPIGVGDTWGGEDMSCFFRCNARLPERFKGQKVALKLYFGGDGLLRIDGQPYHGLDPFRDAVFVADCARGDEAYDLEVESYIMWHFGEGTVKTVEALHWAAFDEEMNAAYWDIRAAFNVLICEDIPSDLTACLREALHDATNGIEQECGDPARVRAMALEAQRIVRERIYDCDRFRKDGLLHLCGNSHLDLVYLWTHAEYDRKLGRTHATALRMMEQYPEYIFSQSQPQMYSRMKELYPQMYEQVKERVREGRWEPVGAFWVEPDCNLISGESMVRQVLHGVRFYREEFGITPQTAWIPDVFGNAWSMPQILVRSGLQYFVTHKMDVWNDTNKWDKHVFWWQGPDGSRIFATVPPTHFIGVCEPDHLNTHWDKFTGKANVRESLYCYGWGDGGGGPDPEMLEYCRRYQDFPGVVSGRMSRIEDALESMHQRALEASDIPVVNDELYLEEHRGVYTTKGRLKKLNRASEQLYRKAECFSCFAPVAYPSEELDRGWKILLTTQFHDSLPGTHTTAAYGELIGMYDEVTGIGLMALEEALEGITGEIDTAGPGRAVVVFNALPAVRSGVVRVLAPEGEAHVETADGETVPSQLTADFESGERVLIFRAAGVPGMGYATYRLVDGPGDAGLDVPADDFVLDNEHLRAEFDERGEIISLIDKARGRECINAERRGNVLQMFEDMPGVFDAWDIEEHYEDTEFDLPPATVEVLERGPVESALRIRRTFFGSTMTQDVVLAAGARRVEFRTWIDWHEQHKVLKMRFHTAVRARQATYDIAYANIQRPTTRNNSYEKAKFEVCGHQWMDLSQTDFGLSLLTDCKYGYEAFGGRIGLTFLKGPKYPDPQSDQEEHRFTYALFPHAGSWIGAGTIEEAGDLNDPMDAVVVDAHPGRLPSRHAFLELDAPGVTLEAVKQAEDGDGLIVRIVERHGAQTTVRLSLPGGIAGACECNLLEDDEADVAVDDGAITFDIQPYEIRTLKIKQVG